MLAFSQYRGVVEGGGSDIASGMRDIAGALEEALRHPTPKTWIALAFFFFILWFVFIRRK